MFFEITRDGIYDISYFVNENTGATEVLLKNPLLPRVIFDDNRPRLYIGPLAPGIAGQDICY